MGSTRTAHRCGDAASPTATAITYWPLAEILKSTAAYWTPIRPTWRWRRSRRSVDDVLTDDVTADRAEPRPHSRTPWASRTRRSASATWIRATSGSRSTPRGDRSSRPWEQRHRRSPSIEDIHWADAALLDLLEELAEGVTGRVLFLCPARPELTARRPGWGGGRRNSPRSRSTHSVADEAEHLIRALLSIDDLPDAVHARILERGEGNPFFLEEILRHLIDGGHVVLRSRRLARGRRRRRGGDPRHRAGRAGRADRPARAGRQTGAAGRGRRRPGLLAGSRPLCSAAASRRRGRHAPRAPGSRPDRFSAFVAHLRRARVHVQARPHTRRRVREPARIGSVPAAHARVAAWIEATAGDRVGEFNELLAYHFSTAARAAREGGTDDAESDRLRSKAFAYLLDASRDSRRRQVLRKAQRMADEALGFAAGPLERSQALATLGLAYYIAGDGDPAGSRSARPPRSVRSPRTPRRGCRRSQRACVRYAHQMARLHAVPSFRRRGPRVPRARPFLPSGRCE